MKFSSSREALLQPIQHVIGAVERKQTSAILSNVLIEAGHESLTLTATDNEIELQSSSDVHSANTGAITVPARKLLDICRSLPEAARIDIELSGQKLKLKSGRSRFTLQTLPAAEFPKLKPIENAQELDLNEGDLNQVIRGTSFSMAQGDVRFYLNGLLMEIGQNKLCCVATDGHRLAYADAEVEVAPENPVRAIIPRKSVMELLRLLKNEDSAARLVISRNHLQVSLADVRITSKLIEGRFPDYNRVIPIDSNKELKLDRELLRQSLSRTAILSNEKYRGVRLALESGFLTISSNNPEQEEAIDEIEVDYAGESVEIGVNFSYLLDVLNTIESAEVVLYLRDGNSSMLVTPEDQARAKYVIMPMRL